MKKLISLLLISVILLLSVGCNSQELPPENSEPVVEARKTYRPEKKEYDNSPFSSGYYNEHDTAYLYFESCLDSTTDIFKATFLGTVKNNTSKTFLFDFEIKEVVKGEIDGNTVSVCVYPKYYMGVGYGGDDYGKVGGYNTNSINYTPGEDYLLILARHATTWMDEDYFLTIHDSLIIPLDKNGTPDINNSKMYNQDLMSHIQYDENKEKIQNGELINLVLEQTKGNPQVIKSSDFIEDTDPTMVMSSATYVLGIEIEYKSDQNIGFDGSQIYHYKVIKSIKGETERISGSFRAKSDKIQVGEKYTIALNEKYALISRNAIFPYTE